MNSSQRVMQALAGGPVDRPPVSAWGHVYHRESSAEDLVAATLEGWERHRWDWIKLNPRKHYHVEPWGVRYRYPGVPDVKPTLEAWPVHSGDDWRAIMVAPWDRGAFAEQIEAVAMLRQRLPADVPILATVFTPLAVLGEMVEQPQQLAAHLQTHPDVVRDALEHVTRTFEALVPHLLRAGADGLYFATVDWASRDLISAEDHRRWSRPYDLRVLAAARQARFHVLHVCKSHDLLFETADYPVQAWSWAAHDPTNPALAEAWARLPGAVMGGLSHDVALLDPSPEPALAELRAGFAATGGRRWLVAPSCSIAPATPASTLAAVRSAVETMRVEPEASPKP